MRWVRQHRRPLALSCLLLLAAATVPAPGAAAVAEDGFSAPTGEGAAVPTTGGAPVDAGSPGADPHPSAPPATGGSLVGDSLRELGRVQGSLQHLVLGPGPLDRLAIGGDLLAVQPPGLVVVVGYSRHAGVDPLENDVRRRLYEAVEDEPGTYVAALVESTGVPRSTARYHLRVLEREGLVERASIRGKHRVAPAGADLRLRAALADEPTRAVLEAVARFEPVSVGGLAEEVDRAPSTVSHHLGRLAEDDLVDRTRDGRQVRITLAPRARTSFESPPGDAATERRAELPVE